MNNQVYFLRTWHGQEWSLCYPCIITKFNAQMMYELKIRYKYIFLYLLHSLILPVSSSSCLLCLLESLILSSLWKPFLNAKNNTIIIKNQASQQFFQVVVKEQQVSISQLPNKRWNWHLTTPTHYKKSINQIKITTK